MSDVLLAPVSDESLYSLHPEEDVTETDFHRHQAIYLETNLRALLRDRYVGANLAVYWIPGQYEEPWVGPDVLVSQPTNRQEPRRVHRVWEQGRIAFVAEVASERTRLKEPEKRETRYRVDLAVPEYLYIDLDRHVLELWRLRDGEYRRVAPVDGRFHSEETGVSFGWDPAQEFVRIWTAEGKMLLTMAENLVVVEDLDRQTREAEAALREARERAREEEARRQAVEAEREAADRRALSVTAERDAARQDALSVTAERDAARQRIAELEAELERLRRASPAPDVAADGAASE